MFENKADNGFVAKSHWDGVIEWCVKSLRGMKFESIPEPVPAFRTAGRFFAQGIDRDGSILWNMPFNNGTTNVGLDNVLSVYLGAGSQTATWFMGLIDNAGFSTLAVGDTMASHAGWAENTNYTESVRQTWSPAAVSGQSITNTTNVTFSINTTVTIAGAFLVSNSTKGGSTGILWATGQFSSAQVLTTGQSLKVTYTCTASAS
jgi:hypothetical protein